jgi:hypothetical protein
MTNETISQQQISTLAARLKLIEDRQAIYDVIVRYCRGIDRREPDLIASAFHDDAIDNHFGVILPFYEAIGTLKAARSGGGSAPAGGSSMHNICNVLIELDGDIARSESYVNVMVRLPHQGKLFDWLHAGRYVDRFERRNGEWRIAYRTVVYDIERFDEVQPPPEGLSQGRYTEKAVRGQKGLGDFSYQILRPDNAK